MGELELVICCHTAKRLACHCCFEPGDLTGSAHKEATYAKSVSSEFPRVLCRISYDGVMGEVGDGDIQTPLDPITGF